MAHERRMLLLLVAEAILLKLLLLMWRKTVSRRFLSDTHNDAYNLPVTRQSVYETKFKPTEPVNISFTNEWLCIALTESKISTQSANFTIVSY
jgi:hypothetical protein